MPIKVNLISYGNKENKNLKNPNITFNLESLRCPKGYDLY